MRCQHLRRQIYDSRPRVVADKVSRIRRCKCYDCGQRWTTYELERAQLAQMVNDEVERRIGLFLSKLDAARESLASDHCQSLRGQVACLSEEDED